MLGDVEQAFSSLLLQLSGSGTLDASDWEQCDFAWRAFQSEKVNHCDQAKYPVQSFHSSAHEQQSGDCHHHLQQPASKIFMLRQQSLGLAKSGILRFRCSAISNSL